MAAFASSNASAHVSVFMDKNVCTLRIGIFEARLALYQPRTQGQQQFCESVPAVGETVFVMQYTHGALDKVPIEFRIIKDVTGRGAYATRADIARAGGVEDATVFYRAPSVTPDVLSVVHDFDEPGWYIGMVTVKHPSLDKSYTAVFPFKVGFAGFGKWPWLVALALVVQLFYWQASGHLSRSWEYLRRLGGRTRLAHGGGARR
jgi:hypothetical protein